jgi:hypothetical protein
MARCWWAAAGRLRAFGEGCEQRESFEAVSGLLRLDQIDDYGHVAQEQLPLMRQGRRGG